MIKWNVNTLTSKHTTRQRISHVSSVAYIAHWGARRTTYTLQVCVYIVWYDRRAIVISDHTQETPNGVSHNNIMNMCVVSHHIHSTHRRVVCHAVAPVCTAASAAAGLGLVLAQCQLSFSSRRIDEANTTSRARECFLIVGRVGLSGVSVR